MKVYKFLFVCCLCLGMIPADAKSEIRFLDEEATSMMEVGKGSSSGVQQNKRKISGKVVDDATQIMKCLMRLSLSDMVL